eukprot:EG_transcript_13728
MTFTGDQSDAAGNWQRWSAAPEGGPPPDDADATYAAFRDGFGPSGPDAGEEAEGAEGEATDDAARDAGAYGSHGGGFGVEDDTMWEDVRRRFEADAQSAAAAAGSTGGGPEAMPESELEDELRFLRTINYKRIPRGYGVVKEWIDYNGYGFILPACGGPDLFVHATEVHSDPATGYRDLAVGELVYYNIKLTEDGKAQATNVTGRNGAYVQGRRGGGIVLEEEDLQPKVAPKKKGVIRDFTESKYWSTEKVPDMEILTANKVPEIESPPVKWWED